MNVLYISIKYVEITGGSLCRENTKAALASIKDIKLSEYLIDLKQSFFSKVFSILRGYKCGYNKQHLKKIIYLIEQKNIQVIFCDPALYGILVAKIKKQKSHVKILSFFHNCEYRLYSSVYSKANPLVRMLILNSVRKNEFLTLRFSDICFFLTNRDLYDLQDVYNITPKRFALTPIVLKNTYNKRNLNIENRFPQKLLFVGSYFKPNIDGLVWFIKQVLPYVNYTLSIVGKGFESEDFKQRIGLSKKLKILGFVESLDIIYETHDIVVEPVFYGSGMKTKTAECLMYGKPLVTTSEGMIGYNFSHKSVFICNSEREFIETLTNLKENHIKIFDETLHNLFQQHYSVDARKRIFQEVLETL